MAAREVDLRVVGHLPGPPESELVELGRGVPTDASQCDLDGDEDAVATTTAIPARSYTAVSAASVDLP